MKNREFYKEEILYLAEKGAICSFLGSKILEPRERGCASTKCPDCRTLFDFWLEEEYKEPEVDWTKVEVDTPILVANGTVWFKRYFAKFENGVVLAWNAGATSWNATGSTAWKYAKLAEKE